MKGGRWLRPGPQHRAPLWGGQSRCSGAAGRHGQGASETGSKGGGKEGEGGVPPRLLCLSPRTPATPRAGAAAHSGRTRRPGGSGGQRVAERPPPPLDLSPASRRARTVQGAAGDAPGPAASPALPAAVPADPPTAPLADRPGRGATVKIRTTQREPRSPRGRPSERGVRRKAGSAGRSTPRPSLPSPRRTAAPPGPPSSRPAPAPAAAAPVSSLPGRKGGPPPRAARRGAAGWGGAASAHAGCGRGGSRRWRWRWSGPCRGGQPVGGCGSRGIGGERGGGARTEP